MIHFSVKIFALLLWPGSPVWAIVVANARKALSRQVIIVMGLVGPCVTFASVGKSVLLLRPLQDVPWLAIGLVAVVTRFVYAGFSWGAVIWAHRVVTECGFPRGFEVRLQSSNRG